MALGIGRVADSSEAAVRDADVVISSLTGPDALRAAYLDTHGAVAGAGRQLFIEMSTGGPDIVAELAAAIAPSGARLVDAPIIGSPAVVRDGQAAILIGGGTANVERATAVLSALGEVRRVVPLGSGARLKLVANSMLADIVLAAAELQVAGEKAGIQSDDVFWVLERLAPLLAARRRGIVDDVHEPTLFALRDLRKDLDLAMGVFRASGFEAPVTALARLLVADATDEYGTFDITAVARPYRAGTRSKDEEVGTIQPLAASHRS